MSDPVREALKESMDRNDMWSALEKPKWSSKPPSEPGWYWCSLHPGRPFCQEVERLSDGGLWLPNRCLTMGQAKECENIQWWPIPIQVPEEEE